MISRRKFFIGAAALSGAVVLPAMTPASVAIKAKTFTLADMARRSPDDHIRRMVEVLTQTNPILDDLVLVEAK